MSGRFFLPFVLSVLTAIGNFDVLAAEVQIGTRKFRLKDGFTVEMVAAPPLVKYPICGDFDEAGRLYVCESSGSMDWNKPQAPENRHRVLRLVDSDGDGNFDKRTIYAEFEMMCQGSMWLDGSLYVAAAPIIWKLTDTDDDGVADRREEWVKTENVTGCLNDLRGPYRGHDGYVYWCKGPSLQEYTVEGKPWASSARHLLRRHPNGKDVDVLMVGGMDNLIEIAFTDGGQRMVTCTYINRLQQPRDDAILHAIYGGVYPKDIAPVFEYPWTGPEMMPPMTSWGAMSPAGLMSYRSEFFGKEYQGNLFSALFSGHKILRHELKAKGSTFECTNEEFFACDDVEFHPTEVMEDADGSLLVIETGGWYRQCCPSSTFYRPDVDGAIYRIRKVDGPRVEDPRGQRIDWTNLSSEDLVGYLDDPRPFVRRRAVDQLVIRGEQGLAALRTRWPQQKNEQARLSGVWAAAQIAGPVSSQFLMQGLDDASSTVRQAALSSLSLRREASASSKLVGLLTSRDPHDQRLAAEALGRLRKPSAVPALLEALEKPVDRSLEHALIYALIEIGDPASVRDALKHDLVQVRRAAMIALDQMPGDGLPAEKVIDALSDADRATQEVAWWIVSRHAKEWGGLLTEQLHRMIAEAADKPEEQQRLRGRISRLARSPVLSEWMVRELTAAGVPAATRMLLLQAMGDTGGQFTEPIWIEGLLTTLRASGRDPDLSSEIIATLAKLPPIRQADPATKKLAADLQQELMLSAQDESRQPSTRLRALTSIRGSLGKIDDKLLQFLLMQMVPEQPYDIRNSAAESLVRARLTPEQQTWLAGRLKNIGLPELNTLLTLFQDAKEDELGQRLVGSLMASQSATNLNAFRVRHLLKNFGPSVQEQAKPFLERLEQSQAELLAKADHVAAMVASADAQRGRQVFYSQKAACTACHKAANVGGITGPALRGIGTRRTERDLIESILFPSASFVQSFETWQVLTEDDQLYVGTLIEDRPEEIVLSGGVDKLYRIPRANIAEMARGEKSLMPDGLDKLVSDQELADLVLYLKSL